MLMEGGADKRLRERGINGKEPEGPEGQAPRKTGGNGGKEGNGGNEGNGRERGNEGNARERKETRGNGRKREGTGEREGTEGNGRERGKGREREGTQGPGGAKIRTLKTVD